MWAVIGLGNPGQKYARTRHNVGFAFIMTIAEAQDLTLRKKKHLSQTGIIQRGGEDVLLAMPQTFMNNSGSAVKRILERERIPVENIVVVYDDLDVKRGEIRIRKTGSAGTHRGMMSIIREIRTDRFPRIRVGIGPLPPGEDAAEYVLSPFRGEERRTVADSLGRAREALDFILRGEIDQAMNLFNHRQQEPMDDQ